MSIDDGPFYDASLTDLLALIRTTPWIAELLAIRFDFDVTRTDPVEQVWLANAEPLAPIAGDAAGGTFLTTPFGGVVYASSEGEGGLIADNLRDALALVVGLPSLHDALARPLGDGLRDWLAEADDEIRRDDAGDPSRDDTRDDARHGPDRLGLDEARARVRQALELPPADGLLAGLHEAMADEFHRPISEHGPYESMAR